MVWILVWTHGVNICLCSCFSSILRFFKTVDHNLIFFKKGRNLGYQIIPLNTSQLNSVCHHYFNMLIRHSIVVLLQQVLFSTYQETYWAQ